MIITIKVEETKEGVVTATLTKKEGKDIKENVKTSGLVIFNTVSSALKNADKTNN